MTRRATQSDVASLVSNIAPFPPGTVILENGKANAQDESHIFVPPRLSNIITAQLNTGHGDGHLVYVPQPSEDPNDPLVSYHPCFSP